MCTALIVRDEYWDRQVDIKISLFNLGDKKDVIKLWLKSCLNLVDFVSRKIGEWINTMIQAAKILFGEIKESWQQACNALSKLFKECDITSEDDFNSFCDKLENKMLFENRKEYIGREQYYKSQFKLIKMNYNVMNHEKRC